MLSVNGVTVLPTIFPDQTSQVWKLHPEAFEPAECRIIWKFESEAEVVRLLQLNHLMSTKYRKRILLIHYLPYARQDKKVANDATFALRSFAHLLNMMEFSEVRCFDPHSDVALELIHNFVPVYPKEQVVKAYINCKADIVAYPDEGAFNKYTRVYKEMGFSHIYGEKTRDQSTGWITGYKLVGSANNQNVLIVDDICDGGATFIHLTKALKEAGAKEVNLFVSHGIFSKGLQPLIDAGINRIFTKEGQIK